MRAAASAAVRLDREEIDAGLQAQVDTDGRATEAQGQPSGRPESQVEALWHHVERGRSPARELPRKPKLTSVPSPARNSVSTESRGSDRTRTPPVIPSSARRSPLGATTKLVASPRFFHATSPLSLVAARCSR